ncbi:MAG: hypothetical protein NT077_03265 [Candidatus Taylorbacteria bacterium]|nr:hypothetical protein [Candidatus Taylorbacteria bacterium]
MPSSKFTDTIVPVPLYVIELSKRKLRTVYCNLRPLQRDDNTHSTDFEEFDEFLRSISSPTTVAIHYQHYRPELFTVVVTLQPVVCWDTDEGLPRLDFEKPRSWNHCPNMWGTFILAIARVDGAWAGDVIADPDSGNFISIVEAYGITTNFTTFRRDVLLPINLSEFQKFDRGRPIQQWVDARLNLRPGHCFEYEAGSNISGIARVVACGTQTRGSNVPCSIVKVT